MKPLLDVISIQYRQDAVENLIDDEKLMFQVQTILLHFTDVERRTIRYFWQQYSDILRRDNFGMHSRKSKSNCCSS